MSGIIYKHVLDIGSDRPNARTAFDELDFAPSSTSPYYMRELDEVLGFLSKVEDDEIVCLALIGKIPVILPRKLAEQLKKLEGKKIGVLKLDGYHIREVA